MKDAGHAAVSPGGQCCRLKKLGQVPTTHPLVFIHPFKGVLGQWVFSVPQLCHHGIQQLWKWTGEAPKEMTSPTSRTYNPSFNPSNAKTYPQLEPWLS